MGNASRELHLLPKAFDEHGVRRVLLSQRLQRDDLVELTIARTIDRAHSTRAEKTEHFVAASEDEGRLCERRELLLAVLEGLLGRDGLRRLDRGVPRCLFRIDHAARS